MVSVDELRALSNPQPNPPSKLPFRPDAIPEHAVAGTAVRRAEAGFDLDGIDDEEDRPSDDDDDSMRSLSDASMSQSDDVGGEEEGSEEEGSEEERDSRRTLAEAKYSAEDAAREADEEAKAASRLRLAHEEEASRARATFAQKALYDSAVDVRIRLEPAIELARHFTPFSPPSDEVDEAGHDRKGAASEDLLSSANALEDIASKLDAVANTVMRSSAHGQSDGDDDPSAWQLKVLDEWAASSISQSKTQVFKAIDTRPSAQVASILTSGRHLQRARKVRVPFELHDGTEMNGVVPAHYDDSELYRALLREVIDSGDAPGGGLRYAQLARSGRVRKKVDRRANKGKKLRYVTYDKLVGFLAPVPLPDPGPVNEIVAALFGGNAP